jgi:hypothetical protein
MALNCIQVEVVREDKDCIEVSSNNENCPIVIGYTYAVSIDFSEPIIEETVFDCYSTRYTVTNFDSRVSYIVNIENMGSASYLGLGAFLYTAPRRDVPMADLVFNMKAKLSTNETAWQEFIPPKLPITPDPIFGTPDITTPNGGDTVTIPISNYNLGTSLYDQPTVIPIDNTYVVYSGSGEVSLVIGADSPPSTTYTIALQGFDDCSSESGIVETQITTNRYTYIEDIITEAECPPLCADGYYFDCATETCVVAFSALSMILETRSFTIDVSSSDLEVSDAGDGWFTVVYKASFMTKDGYTWSGVPEIDYFSQELGDVNGYISMIDSFPYTPKATTNTFVSALPEIGSSYNGGIVIGYGDYKENVYEDGNNGQIQEWLDLPNVDTWATIAWNVHSEIRRTIYYK